MVSCPRRRGLGLGRSTVRSKYGYGAGFDNLKSSGWLLSLSPNFSRTSIRDYTYRVAVEGRALARGVFRVRTTGLPNESSGT